MSTRLPQRRIGRYEVIDEIGRGVTTVVYEARDSALARVIALKTIEVPPQVLEAEGDAFEKRFFQEARVAARLSHPGLVQVHDVGRDPETGRLFIAFERVHGRSLDALADGKPLDWHEACRIVARVARAMEHAHAHGVIHRDLKPANIVVVTETGEPKVLDFGVAKVDTTKLNVTATGQFFGTPLYLSPEQAEGRTVDGRSDVFSLGAVLYRLLTAQHAFAAENVSEIVRRVIEEEPTPPSVLAPVPAAVEAIVARALAKSLSERYDATSLAEDLEDVLDGRAPRHAGGLAAVEPENLPFAPDAAAPAAAVAETLRPGPPKTLPDAGWQTEASKPERADRTWLPGEHTLLRRRGSLRAAFGAAILVAVVLAHVLRDKGETPPVLRLPSPAPAGVATATPPPLVSEQAEEELGRRAGETGDSAPVPGAPARLVLDVEHPLPSGLLAVYVNGEKLFQRRLRAPVTKNVLGVKLRRQRLRETIDVDPGRKRLVVQVSWEDERKSEAIVGTFKPGSTRRLRIRISRLGKALSLDWI